MSLDLLSGLFWLLIAFLVCVQSLNIGVRTFSSPGPGFFPFWSGIVVGTLAIALLVEVITKKQKMGDIAYSPGKVEFVKLITVIVSLFIYSVFIDKVGYLLMTFVQMMVLFAIIGGSKFWVQLLSAIITALLSYVIFHNLLNVQLPRGIFSF